jgi:hypothetical protein
VPRSNAHPDTVAASSNRHATRSGVRPDTNIPLPRRTGLLAVAAAERRQRAAAAEDRCGCRLKQKSEPRRPIHRSKQMRQRMSSVPSTSCSDPHACALRNFWSIASDGLNAKDRTVRPRVRQIAPGTGCKAEMQRRKV